SRIDQGYRRIPLDGGIRVSLPEIREVREQSGDRSVLHGGCVCADRCGADYAVSPDEWTAAGICCHPPSGSTHHRPLYLLYFGGKGSPLPEKIRRDGYHQSWYCRHFLCDRDPV